MTNRERISLLRKIANRLKDYDDSDTLVFLEKGEMKLLKESLNYAIKTCDKAESRRQATNNH